VVARSVRVHGELIQWRILAHTATAIATHSLTCASLSMLLWMRAMSSRSWDTSLLKGFSIKCPISSIPYMAHDDSDIMPATSQEMQNM